MEVPENVTGPSKVGAAVGAVAQTLLAPPLSGMHCPVLQAACPAAVQSRPGLQ